MQTPDFDGKPLKLVDDAYALSKQFQTPRNTQYSRDYKLYQSYLDMTNRNPDKANIFIPKIRSIIETKTASEGRALFSTSPYIPFTSRRKEFKEQASIMTDVLDGYLLKADFYQKAISSLRNKITYGTSFMEAVPYYTSVKQKAIVPEMVYGLQVGMKVEEFEVPRLRLKIKDWAPWEIYADPYATGLEEKGACRFVIKMQLASRRQIIEMAKVGAYPELDIEKLEQDGSGSEVGDHKGLEILSDIGLPNLSAGDDQGIVMRYESDDRYIDVWNNRVVLRDIPNPFNHGTINLTRFIHSQDAHTQNKFWGLGEAKSNEILQAMLNDLYNMTFNNHEMVNQPMIYYKKGSVNPAALVRTSGNRVAIDSEPGRPLSDAIQESAGGQLPGDHYNLPQVVERLMDLNSRSFAPNRGESDSKRKTLGEAAMLKETGDLGGELSVKLGEKIFLADFGSKCMSHVDQFASTDDLVEEVGLEKAALLSTTNPQDLPGGFNFEFKGSDRVANAMIKQRNLRELAPLLLQIPNIHPGAFAKVLLETHDMDLDLEELIIPDETMMQLELMAAQGEQQLEEQLMQVKQAGKDPKQPLGGSTPNNVTTKSKVNTTAQVAHDAGQESTKGVSK